MFYFINVNIEMYKNLDLQITSEHLSRLRDKNYKLTKLDADKITTNKITHEQISKG